MAQLDEKEIITLFYPLRGKLEKKQIFLFLFPDGLGAKECEYQIKEFGNEQRTQTRNADR